MCGLGNKVNHRSENTFTKSFSHSKYAVPLSEYYYMEQYLVLMAQSKQHFNSIFPLHCGKTNSESLSPHMFKW